MTPPRRPLRHALPTDARALVRLQQGIYREGSWFIGDGPPAVDTLLRRLRSLDGEQSLYLVAVDGDEPCAYLELNRLYPTRLQHVAVLTLAVAAGYRRQGLGRTLLRRSYGWAERVGVRKLSLGVRANNHAAIALYEREGFTVEGREREQIRNGDGFEDNLLMARFLVGDESVD